MGNRYVVRCRCGRGLPVGLAQAGQVVECSCGASLEVPRMRELAALERVDHAAASSRRRKWGAAGRVRLAGIAITLLGAALAGYLWWSRPMPPSPLQLDDAKLRSVLDTVSPLNALQLFDALPRDLQRSPRQDEQIYLVVAQRHRRWMGVSMAILGIGLATVVASLFVPGSGPHATTA